MLGSFLLNQRAGEFIGLACWHPYLERKELRQQWCEHIKAETDQVKEGDVGTLVTGDGWVSGAKNR